MSSPSSLRRRNKPGRTEYVEESEGDVNKVTVVHHVTVADLKDPKSWKALMTGKRAMLTLGLLVGFLACTLLLTHPPASLSLLLEEYDLPSLGSAEVEWRELFSERIGMVASFCVGEELSARGLEAKYPVILIPGIISTALENWSTVGEYKNQFRKRYWGGASMVLRAIQNPERWMAALMLDPETGLDPPGIKIRAAQGIDAAQKFIEGYWLWEKILQNLAGLNYDTNNLELAAYDWRLSFRNLEIRDGYFSRLKHSIESYKYGHRAPNEPYLFSPSKRQKKKAVIVAHSMGSTLILYFLKWVEAEHGGKGGPQWVENNIESIISIGGTFLGVPKAMPSLFSGEMKDTVSIGPAATYVLERYFGKEERAKLFRSWAGSASMWIKGGDTIWGNETHAPDDIDGQGHTQGHFISFRPKEGEDVPDIMQNPGAGNLTVSQASDWILSHTPTSYQRMIQANYSFGFERDEAQLKANNEDFRKWTNPLEVQLPIAPSMKMYCIYGHGLETERSYWYARGKFMHDETKADAGQPQCDAGADCTSPYSDFPLLRNSFIDSSMTNEGATPKLRNGVKIGEGDGTVALLSLGAMCVEGWRRKRWNPGGIKVVTHEVPHIPEAYHIRGGATSGDHIDILGGTPLNEIIGKVATGAGDEVTQKIVSPIMSYAERIDWDAGHKTEFVW